MFCLDMKEHKEKIGAIRVNTYFVKYFTSLMVGIYWCLMILLWVHGGIAKRSEILTFAIFPYFTSVNYECSMRQAHYFVELFCQVRGRGVVKAANLI